MYCKFIKKCIFDETKTKKMNQSDEKKQKNEEKAYSLLREELIKIEGDEMTEHTHCETISIGTAVCSYYVIFNNGDDDLKHYTFKVNIKTEKIKRIKKSKI